MPTLVDNDMNRNIYLARAKSEAHFNIYRFLKENLKSRKKKGQGEDNENGKKQAHFFF